MGREPRSHREFDRALIEHRQHPGHSHAHRADVLVGGRTERGRASAEHLGSRRKMRVDFESYYRFEIVNTHTLGARRSNAPDPSSASPTRKIVASLTACPIIR